MGWVMLVLWVAVEGTAGAAARARTVRLQRAPAPITDELAARVRAELAMAGFTVADVACFEACPAADEEASDPAAPPPAIVTLRVRGRTARIDARVPGGAQDFAGEVIVAGDGGAASRAVGRAAVQIAEWMTATWVDDGVALPTAPPPADDPPTVRPTSPAPLTTAVASAPPSAAVAGQAPQMLARSLGLALDLGGLALRVPNLGRRLGPEVGVAVRIPRADVGNAKAFARASLSLPRVGGSVEQVGVDYATVAFAGGLERRVGRDWPLSYEASAILGVTVVSYTAPVFVQIERATTAALMFGASGGAVIHVADRWAFVAELRATWFAPSPAVSGGIESVPSYAPSVTFATVLRYLL